MLAPHELRTWIGAGGVVRRKGRPLLTYHGTDRQFTTFDTRFISDRSREGGFFFTPERCRSKPYGKYIVEAYLRFENPFEIDPLNWLDENRPTIDDLRDRGHDGIIIDGDVTSAGDPDWEFGADVFIVFSPEQILIVRQYDRSIQYDCEAPAP